ncbi:hypothetical protein GX48_01142 [Paracoccidioides brasiliensis]|nr:hypothetical protein GX48_01142 [Paracoccidioides brasiliensis]
MLQYGSWNPALRPDNGPMASYLSLTDSSSTSLSTKHSKPASHTPPKIQQLQMPAGGDPVVESTLVEHSNGASRSVGEIGGDDVDVQIIHPSDQEQPTETSNEAPSGDAYGNGGESVHPSREKIQLVEQEATSHKARSGGFQWGDDGGVNSAWDISRSSTEPFKEYDVAGRTNSFPSMDPGNDFDSDGSHSHDTTLESDASDSGNLDSNNRTTTVENGLYSNSHEQNASMPWGATGIEEDTAGDFFNQLNTQTKPIYTPVEAESRFEEGVPLINDSEPSSPAEHNQPDIIDAIFKEDEPVDDGDFFGSKSKMPPLNRKSTSQVLDSLHFEQGNAMTDSPTDVTPAKNQLESTDNRTSEENVAQEDVPEDVLAERWKAVLTDDDLLMDDDLDDLDAPHDSDRDLPNGPSEGAFAYQPPAPVQVSEVSAQRQPRANPYTPHQLPSSNIMQEFPGPGYGLSNAGAFTTPVRPYTGNSNSSKPESFSNQAKAGYQSPYDLPMELTRPKHHSSQPLVSQPLPAAQVPAVQTPPRQSSMTASRPTSSSSAYSPAKLVPPPLSRRGTEGATSSNNFFEELPVTSKRRPSTGIKYAPPQTMAHPAASLPLSSMPTNVMTPPSQPQKASDHYQLQNPERLDPYSTLPVPTGRTISGPSGRYSPRPPAVHPGSRPLSSPRYSPVPPPSTAPPASNRYSSQPMTSYSPSHLFQPRTSSPLAYHEYVSHDQPTHSQSENENGPPFFPGPGPRQPSDLTRSPHSNLRNETVQNQPANEYLPLTSRRTGSSSQFADRFSPSLPSDRNPFEPAYHAQATPAAATAPSYPPHPPALVQLQQSPEDQPPRTPRSSRTSSPGRLQCEPSIASVPEPFQVPASVHSPIPPLQPQPQSLIKEAFTPQLDFIYPTDGQELDPLERWKGAPIFKFGFGGVIASSFPKHIPRYASGQLVPKIKSSPGETKVRFVGDVIAQMEPSVKFPGPLRSKSKKKDVIAWLSAMISKFENELAYLEASTQQQHNEKILLWKLIRVMVEHDGLLGGNAEVDNAVHSILSPVPDMTRPSSQDFGHSTQLSSVYESINGTTQSEPASVDGLESIRRCLLTGGREKAVWEAVDRRLWGHAMLMSSTLDKSVWKQVMQEFIRREVRTAGDNTESLAALYEIFAGNMEESVDELVPPSARAGLQMVSKTQGPGHPKNALCGLDKWQETLCLILSNRSPDDQVALLALSRLLSSYGRIEASHICAVFARSASVPLAFGGPDDPQSQIVLLGADHRRYPFTFVNDRDSILLTEVYEFALSILPGAATVVVPHLQAFKLNYALSLAENGSKAEAQQYCDAIGAILKSTTKPSQYYHQRFYFELDELANRLRQSPTGGSSWMSKPNMEKVSGSILAKFNSFVVGDDSDGNSTTPGKPSDADIGPFAKMVGTPPVSRSPSVNDTFGPYFAAGQPILTMASTSRYAAGNQYAPYSSPDQYRGRASLDSQRSPPSTGRSYSQRGLSQERSSISDINYNPLSQQNVYSPPSAYAHLAPVEEIQSTQSSDEQALEQPSSFGGYQPNFNQQPTTREGLGGAAARNTGYEPPTGTTGYEPPTYEPGPMDDGDSDKEKPKRSFMDDEDGDDLAAREAAAKKAEKTRKDREADETFKKAAEEDAKKPVPEKKGWFTWWGKKDTNASGGGPIRAKLGEENSFYYDKELKRWVNKKDPSSATATALSTPPPPKGTAPPNRTASANNASPPPGTGIPTPASAPSLAPPPNPSKGSLSPSGDSSPQNLSPGSPSLPPSASPYLTPLSVSAGPPTRPGTALSNASSIDDLIGAPQARKGSTVRGKKKGRGYVDVMAK